ncbi:alpha/beta hydrolase [Paraferrimonas sp. SM1919]|uniref:alpha/beta hydrolase n=1 Tax=Paraferrimonas sp. SM1919 TaxID=2662263 RepID=UPI0013D5FB13|nr:alpha/beta hydrolase-fold protein [Paraferrimonas sp. SM1919]
MKQLIAFMLIMVTLPSYGLDNLVQFEVKSKHLKETIQLIAALPQGYENSDKRYPMLFDFHPRSINYLNGMQDWMSHNGDWPWLKTIVITSRTESRELGDLKSSFWDDGNTDAFYDMVENELLVEIDKRFRTNGYRILNGFTGNATFSLYTLLNKPHLFNAYFAASPILSQDAGNIIKDINQLEKLPEGKFLFISRGNSDYEQRQITSHDQLLEKLATLDTKLQWHSELFEKNYYMSMPVLATANAIERLFDDIHIPLAADSDISKQGPQAIVNHYKKLSAVKYGFEVKPVTSLITLAKSQEYPQAVNTLNFTTKLYPKAFMAFNSLADLHKANNQIDKAIAAQKSAIAGTDHPFWQKRFSDKLALLQKL